MEEWLEIEEMVLNYNDLFTSEGLFGKKPCFVPGKITDA